MERMWKVRAIREAEERAKWEENERIRRVSRRQYSSKNFIGLKLSTSLAPIAVLVVTYFMFLSPISIIGKWSVMPWWGCILYIIGIPVGIFLAALLGCIPGLSKGYNADTVESAISIPIISWSIYAIVALIPTSATCYGLYITLLVIISLICFITWVFPGLLSDWILYEPGVDYRLTIDSRDIICYADESGNYKFGKTALVSLALQSVLTGVSIMIFIML